MRKLLLVTALAITQPVQAMEPACMMAAEVGYVSTVMNARECMIRLTKEGQYRLDDIVTAAYDRDPSNFGRCFDAGRQTLAWRIQNKMPWHKICSDVLVTLYSNNNSWGMTP